MAQSDSKDGFYTQPYRYGEKNLKLRQYNRDREMTGMRGYPSDKEYMKAVADSTKERDDESMRRAGDKAAPKKKITAREGAKKVAPSKATKTRKRISTKR
jgi:hypothetical protein